MTKEIRVRFAPSPTGGLHPGNARIAVFNWLFAENEKYKGMGAKYVLRIEDTDEERSTSEYEKSILEDLTWLGITWDEGPFRQSERGARYKEVASNLLEKGSVYKCYCTEEELETLRLKQSKAGKPPRYEGKCKDLSLEEKSNHEKNNTPYVLRFDVEKFMRDLNNGANVISYKDLIKNKNTEEEIGHALSVIGDFVITKTSGIPTYNFAVVVDDIDMKITHVFRGEDHIPNTFRQLMLFETINKLLHGGNLELLKYGHLPMLLAPDKTKLSKRSGGVPIHEYKAMGFFAETIFNHLAFLGGGLKGIDETVDRKEMIKAFDYKETAVSACVYDIEKLKNVNSKMIHKKNAKSILNILIKEFNLGTEWNKYYKEDEFVKIIDLSKEGVKTLLEVIETSEMFMPVVAEEALFSDFSNEQKTVLNNIYNNYVVARKNISGENWKEIKSSIVSSSPISGGKLFKTLRAILTTRKDGPPLDEIMSLINNEVVLARVEIVKKLLG